MLLTLFNSLLVLLGSGENKKMKPLLFNASLYYIRNADFNFNNFGLLESQTEK